MKNRILLILAFLIISCTHQNTKIMLGNWQTVQGDWHAKIYQEGNIIILKDSSLDATNTTYEIIKKGKDYYINTPYTLMKISYLKDQDKLIFNGKEWIRVTK